MEKITDQLRRVVRESGLSQRRLGRETGLDPATINRFLLGKGLSMEALDAIGDYLGLVVVAKRKAVK